MRKRALRLIRYIQILFKCLFFVSIIKADSDSSNIEKAFNDSYNLFTKSFKAIINNSKRRNEACKILFFIFCTSINTVLILLLLLYHIRRRLNVAISIPTRILNTIIYFLSILSSKIFNTKTNILLKFGILSAKKMIAIKNILLTMLAINIAQRIIVFLLQRIQKNLFVIRLINMFIHFIAGLWLAKYCILMSCCFGDINTEEFLHSIQKIQHVILIAMILIASLTIKIIYPKTEYYKYTSHAVSVSAIAAFCSYFINISLENLLWLFITYSLLKYGISIFFVTIYKIIESLPAYTPNPYHQKDEKNSFIKMIRMLQRISSISIIPLCSAIYLKLFFNIFIISNAVNFLGHDFVMGLISFIILISTLILMILVTHYLCGYYASIATYRDSAAEYRGMTFARISANIISFFLVLLCFFCLPYILNFKIDTAFTALGLMFSAISFASKDVIEDIIQGMLALYEGTIQRGDIIAFDDKVGTIEDMSIRCVHVRCDDGSIITIPFRLLGKSWFGNKNRGFCQIVFNTSITHKITYARAQEIIRNAFKIIEKSEIGEYLLKDEVVIRGLSDITAFSYVIQYSIQTKPLYDQIVLRAFNEALLSLFAEEVSFIASPMVANITLVPSVRTGHKYPDHY